MLVTSHTGLRGLGVERGPPEASLETRGKRLYQFSAPGTRKLHRVWQKARCHTCTETPLNLTGLASRGWKVLQKV